MKNDKGITLMALVITIIVLLIISAIAVNSGVETIEFARFNKAKSELETIQSQVNLWYNEYDSKKTEQEKLAFISSIGLATSDSSCDPGLLNSTVQSNNINRNDYRFLSTDYIKTNLELDLDNEFLINIPQRMVILFGGIDYKNDIYYTSDEFELINIENSEVVTNINFQLSQGDNTDIIISDLTFSDSSGNVNISKFKVQYAKSGTNEWKDITNSLVKYTDEMDEGKVKYKFKTPKIASQVPIRNSYDVKVMTTDNKKEKVGTVNILQGDGIQDYNTEPNEFIYVTLYSDNNLVFSNNTGKLDKTITKEYIVEKDDIYDSPESVPWHNEVNNIQVVNFINKIVPTSTQRWFVYCSNLSTINNIDNLEMSQVTTTNRMFYDCENLTSIELSTFDTCNVTDMHGMFYQCMKLTSLDLSSFNTNKVTDMSYMFNRCSELKTIYVGSDFTIENVSTDDYMFYSCSKLVGGNGTPYNSSYNGKTYARIDNSSQTGYFTDIRQNLIQSNTELSYIESTGTQYINTNYKPCQDTKVDIIMESINWGEYKCPFAVRTADNSSGDWVYTNRYAIWLYQNKNYYLHLGKDELKKNAVLNYDYTNTKFHLITENGKITIKDLKNNYNEEISTFETVGNFRTDYNLVLGALSNSDNILNLCQYRIYSCKIYEGNSLVRDYIPVNNTIINKKGLYDKVVGEFYRASGEGNFN